jgi:hypothetical protein
MRVRVQRVWNGRELGYRLLISGGLRIWDDREWCRAVASKALDRLESEGFVRHKIRFIHS